MPTLERRSRTAKNQFRRWLFEGLRASQSKAPAGHTDVWWRVMCLTGVDYFSTLGYQPGIAFLAAGLLSPIATAIVVIMTVFGLIPLYFRVAEESPHGQGSVSMLEKLLPGWKGKALVLVLLGFAATGFIITITLSAADATAHIVQNPMCPPFLHHRVLLTMLMITILGGVFLKGFREAIGFSFLIVGLYLICNAAVLVVTGDQVVHHPELIKNWANMLNQQYHYFPVMLGLSLILFPKLALGTSGFETGVAVMPLVRGLPNDDPAKPMGRIKNTRKLLLTAALIMAVFLLASGLITTLLIPPEAFQEHGAANGRALAYLAHKYMGEGWGTAYDASTILILWFAGASAIAGLLNLVPRYLPRFGMAPEWASAQRPLVIFFTLVSYGVTLIFNADVDAQAGAYATGILVLFTSAAFAVMLVTWKEGLQKRILFTTIFIVFVYTSIANMVQRPEGLQIASFFIISILITSLVSRAIRAIELRTDKVVLDPQAEAFVQEVLHSESGHICLLAHRPGATDYGAKEAETRLRHKLTLDEASFIFLEVSLGDPSDFSDESLEVTGHLIDNFKVLRCTSPAIPNAIAAILLHLRDETKTIPYAYFGWTEGNPLSYVFRYIFFGEGETAPVAREILRETERNPAKRPVIIVG